MRHNTTNCKQWAFGEMKIKTRTALFHDLPFEFAPMHQEGPKKMLARTILYALSFISVKSHKMNRQILTKNHGPLFFLKPLCKVLCFRILPLSLFALAYISPVFSQGSDDNKDKNLVDSPEKTDEANSEAVLEAQKGKYSQAINRFKKIVSIQDQNVAATYNNLGYTYLLKGDYQNAIDNYRKAVERNPVLIPSLVNLGKLLYQAGEFKEAITFGERVISLDPRNASVREWLPDAYKKAADKRMFELAHMAEKNEQQKNNDKESQGNVEAKKSDKKPPSEIELKTLFEFALNKQTKVLAFYGPATTIPFPYSLSADVWASPSIQISMEAEVPKMGLNLPYFITSEEYLNFTVHGKYLYYGFGVLFSQANFWVDNVYGMGHFIHNSAYPKRNDTKLGFILGIKKEFTSFLFYVYPLYAFRDSTVGPQSIEYDRSITKLEYRVIYPEDREKGFLPWHFELGLGFKANEYFVTEYNISPTNATVGHYIGVYDFYVDLSFGKIRPEFDKIPFQLGFHLGARLYFLDFDYSNPFGFLNGQGYLGFSTDWSLAGTSFRTYKTASLVFDIYARQLFFNKLVVTEKAGIEISKATDPFNGFYFTLGMAYTF